MFRSPEDKPSTITTINCLVSGGGLGDLICSLPAINYLLTNAPWLNVLIWCPDYLKAFFKHVLPKNAIVRNFEEAQTKYDNKKYGITTQWTNQHTPMRTHAVKYSFHVLTDYSPTIPEMSYLKIRPEEINISKFNLPEKYVVLPGAATEKVKTMPVETFNQLVDYVITKGYKPVVLGKTENTTGVGDIKSVSSIPEYDFSKCINLTNKTNILESAAIIANSKLFIGMDSGLTHLAGFTETPMVVGYTFINPETQIPVRDGIMGKNVYTITPDDSLGCKGCQSNWTMMFNHDFRNCFYKDYLCSQQMTFEKFKSKIEENNLL